MNLFERLDLGRPTEAKVKQPDKDPAQRLLDWLINHWSKPSITAREIQQFGPRVIRDQKSVSDATKILVKQGWLTPVETHRRDAREWLITRKPIVFPTIATETIEINP
jgi:hypothetical protein